MPPKIDLKTIEKKAWTTYFQDGLLDIVLGSLLLVSVLSSTLSEIGVSDVVRISIYVPLMFLCPAIYALGKKYITVPRLGFVKFGPKRKARSKKMFIGLVITQLILLIILVLSITKAVDLGVAGSILVTLNVLVALCLLAYYLDYPRMYLFAMLFAMSEPIHYYLKNHTSVTHIGSIAYGIPGGIILLIGIVTFIRFLKRYPSTSREGLDAG